MNVPVSKTVIKEFNDVPKSRCAWRHSRVNRSDLPARRVRLYPLEARVGADPMSVNAASISSPPVVNRPDLTLRLWSGPNLQIHRLRRSSSTRAEAERSPPACADVQDFKSVSCRA